MKNKIRLVYPKGRTKAVTLSYDDGKVSDRKMVSILNRYGIKGTFNLSFGKLGKTGTHLDYIFPEEIGELYENHEVACHTYNHSTVTLLSKSELMSEILENRVVLEKFVKYPVRGFAYPMGVYNDSVKEVLRLCQIEYARLARSTQRFDIPNDFLSWSATCHHNNDLLDKTQEFIDRARPGILGLMVVWGHSYEFEEQNNWELLEAFSEKIYQQNDMWFATNIQIVNYFKSFERLLFAADNSFVVNPTATEITLLVNDEELIVVKPSEKIFLNS